MCKISEPTYTSYNFRILITFQKNNYEDRVNNTH